MTINEKIELETLRAEVVQLNRLVANLKLQVLLLEQLNAGLLDMLAIHEEMNA